MGGRVPYPSFGSLETVAVIAAEGLRGLRGGRVWAGALWMVEQSRELGVQSVFVDMAEPVCHVSSAIV